MAAERIGLARCPLCRHSRARLGLTKSGLACMTCDACNLQMFARSANSDERLRALHVPDAAPAEAAPAPAAAAPAAPAPAATTTTTSTTQAAPRGLGWGVFA